MSRSGTAPNLVQAAAVKLENDRLREEIRAMCNTIKYQSSQLSELWTETKLLQARWTSKAQRVPSMSSLVRGVAELSRRQLDPGAMGAGSHSELSRAQSAGSLLSTGSQPGAGLRRTAASGPNSDPSLSLGGFDAPLAPHLGLSNKETDGLEGSALDSVHTNSEVGPLPPNWQPAGGLYSQANSMRPLGHQSSQKRLPLFRPTLSPPPSTHLRERKPPPAPVVAESVHQPGQVAVDVPEPTRGSGIAMEGHEDLPSVPWLPRETHPVPSQSRDPVQQLHQTQVSNKISYPPCTNGGAVSFTLLAQNINISELCSRRNLASAFKAAIQSAVAQELGHNFLPEYVDVRLSPDSAAIPVVVLPPAGMSARELHAQLCTRQLPGWSVAGRVASLEGFRSVCLSSLWVLCSVGMPSVVAVASDELASTTVSAGSPLAEGLEHKSSSLDVPEVPQAKGFREVKPSELMEVYSAELRMAQTTHPHSGQCCWVVRITKICRTASTFPVRPRTARTQGICSLRHRRRRRGRASSSDSGCRDRTADILGRGAQLHRSGVAFSQSAGGCVEATAFEGSGRAASSRDEKAFPAECGAWSGYIGGACLGTTGSLRRDSGKAAGRSSQCCKTWRARLPQPDAYVTYVTDLGIGSVSFLAISSSRLILATRRKCHWNGDAFTGFESGQSSDGAAYTGCRAAFERGAMKLCRQAPPPAVEPVIKEAPPPSHAEPQQPPKKAVAEIVKIDSDEDEEEEEEEVSYDKLIFKTTNRRQVSQTSYGAMEGGEADGAATLQPVDTAGASGDGVGSASEEAPAAEASPQPSQPEEESAGPGPARGLLNLPEGALRQALGNSADFLTLVGTLQSLMSGRSDQPGTDAQPEEATEPQSFLSFESAEATPTARGTSDSAAQAQGTPDFPHRVQEELSGGISMDAGFASGREVRAGERREPLAGPLFAPEQMAQWARLEQGAPLLYGTPQGQESFRTLPRSETPSVMSSGEIQAEVRRQLDAIRMSHAVQLEALARENEQLRRQAAGSFRGEEHAQAALASQSMPTQLGFVGFCNQWTTWDSVSNAINTSDQLWTLATKEASDWYKKYQSQTPVGRLSTTVAKTVAEAVSELRMWKRWTVRLTDLGGSIPDPAVLLKALTTITSGPLSTMPDVAFRVQLIKATLQVDVTPTTASVQQLYECLLTELEGEVKFGKAAARARSVKEEDRSERDLPKPPKSPPKLPPPPKGSQAEGKSERCRAFHGGNGCKRGAQCPYLHEWTAIPKAERSKLCMLCGATGHRKDQCTSPATPKSPKKGDGTKPEAKPQPPAASSASSGGATAKAGQGFTAKQLEAQKLQGPMESCEVSLAGDVRRTWGKTPGGTLVVPTEHPGSTSEASPQTLVPLGAVVSKLGCKLTWSRAKGLRLQHPKRGLLPTKIVNGCPQLPNEVALELVKELEMCNSGPSGERTQELYQAVLLDHLADDPERSLKEYIAQGTKVQALQAMLACAPFREFTALCQGLAVDSPVSDDQGWEALKSLPLPRRARKRLFRSPWIVNFGSPRSAFFTQVLRSKGFEVLEVGQGAEECWTSLLWGALSGRVSAVLSGEGFEEEDRVVETIRPLWLWTLASMAQGSCLPLMRRAETSQEEGLDSLGKGFKSGFLKWSGCDTVRCGSGELVTNMKLGHLEHDFPQGASASQFEEELGRALFGIPSAVWKLEALEAIQACWEDPEFSEVVSLWFKEDRRVAFLRSEAQAAAEGALPRSEAQAAAEGALPRSEAQAAAEGARPRSEAQAAAEGALPRSQAQVEGALPRSQAQVEGASPRSEAQVEGASPRSKAQAAAEGAPLRFKTRALAEGAFSRSQVPNAPDEVSQGAPAHADSEEESRLLTQDSCLRATAPAFVPSTIDQGLQGREAILQLLMQQEAVQEELSSPLDATVNAASVEAEGEQEESAPILSPEQRRKWLAHIQAGHWPYRKDCQVCVRGSAVGLQHRRVQHKDSYVLSYDLAGPFKEVGRSFDATGYRYLLVAGYRVPRELLTQSTEGGAGEPPPPDSALELSATGCSENGHPEEPPQPLVPEDDDDSGSIDFGEEGVPDLEEEPHVASPLEESILEGDFQESDLEEYVASLQEPIPQEVLRFSVPLKTRHPKGILEALQQICGEVHRLGLPVHRLHSDREGTSEAIKKWCYQNLIVPSYTQGQDPQSNGLAERLVGWFKAKMRTSLASSDLPIKFWPLAAMHAAQTYTHRVCGRPLPPFFGQVVWFKGKTPTSQPKRVFVKCERGRYLAPSTCETEGHWILREATRAILSTRNLRANLVHPEKVLAEDLPELVAEDEVSGVEDPAMSPYRRISRKSRDPISQGPSALSVKVEMQGEEAELRAQVLLHRKDFRPAAALQVLNLLEWSSSNKAPRGSASGYELFGGFRHGGIQGISRAARQHPGVTAFLNAYLQHHSRNEGSGEPPTWTSIVVYADPEVDPHVDHRNEPGTANYVLVIPGRTCLWTAERVGPQSIPAGSLSPEEGKGYLTVLGHRLQTFSPKVRHSLVRTPDFVVACFTPLGIHLEGEEARLMKDLGFPLGHAEEARSVRFEHSTVCMVQAEDTGLEEDVQPDTSATVEVGWEPCESLEQRLSRLGLERYLSRFRHEGLVEIRDLEFLFREDFVDMGLSLEDSTRLLEGFPGQIRVRPDLPQRAHQMPTPIPDISHPVPLSSERKEVQDEREEEEKLVQDLQGIHLCKVEAVPEEPVEDVYRGSYNYWCISEEEWYSFISAASDPARRSLWNALTEANYRYYGGRVLNLGTQILFPPATADNRLIAGCVSNAVLHQELHTLDLILKGRLQPGPDGPEYQRSLLGQVLSVKGYPRGGREYRIALRVRRTVDDVDDQGNYLGDVFMLIDIAVTVSTVPASEQELRAVSEDFPERGDRVRAEYMGPDTDPTFGEVESYIFPVPAIVVDDDQPSPSITGDVWSSGDDGMEEEADGLEATSSTANIPSICKIVGPNPQGQGPPPSQEGAPEGRRRVRMDVRYTRLTPQSWEDICTLPERDFEQAMERLSREMRTGSHSDTGTLSDHIPQGLLVSTVIDQCDWSVNPTLTLHTENGEEVPLADVLRFHEDAAEPGVPVDQRFLIFTVYDRIRDVVEVILIVARLVTEVEDPVEAARGSDHHVPRPPGPDPPAIRAVRLPPHLSEEVQPAGSSQRRSLSVIPVERAWPAYLPSLSNLRFSSAVAREESGDASSETPRLRAVSESLYTDNLESILEELEKCGKQLETTHTARPSEVKQHLERWVEAMRAELEGHLEIGSLTRHVGEEARSLLSTPGAEVLPALAVYTAKPPKAGSKKAYRRKCRAVACGNFTEITSEENTYSAGAQAEAVRIALAVASGEPWAAYVTDISQAFLRAPLPDLERLILLRPPAHFVLAGICQASEVWRARRAVYGLREAPKWWSDYRDRVLSQASWDCDGEEMHLEQLEGSVWLLKDRNGQRRGIVVVYVDDCLVLSTYEQARDFHAYLNEVWETSPLESCQEVGDMVQFLGMNITKTASGFSLGQQPYLNDLMAKYDVHSSSPQTVPRDWIKEEPEQQEYDGADLRRAQSIVGELLWVSQRTRPDISHTTALLASWSTKDPSLVYKLGIRMLHYLYGTLDHQLVIEASPGEENLQCFTDASFSPYGSRSYSGIAIKFRGCLVLWRATKQSLITLSSSEAELIAATEGIVLSVGVREVLQQVIGRSLVIDLLVDNTSALQLLQGRGANRTRHLRIRSNFVKERVDAKEITLLHVPGETQQADLLTKVLPGPRLKFLRGLVGLQGLEEGEPHVVQAASVQPRGLDNLQGWLFFLISCIQAYTADGQEEDLARLEVDPPYELMLLTALVVLSVLAVWEGGRGLVNCCVTRARPRVRSVTTTKGKSVEDRVKEAIKKELGEQGVRQDHGLVSRARALRVDPSSSSGQVAPPLQVSAPPTVVPPPPVSTYRGDLPTGIPIHQVPDQEVLEELLNQETEPGSLLSCKCQPMNLSSTLHAAAKQLGGPPKDLSEACDALWRLLFRLRSAPGGCDEGGIAMISCPSTSQWRAVVITTVFRMRAQQDHIPASESTTWLAASTSIPVVLPLERLAVLLEECAVDGLCVTLGGPSAEAIAVFGSLESFPSTGADAEQKAAAKAKASKLRAKDEALFPCSAWFALMAASMSPEFPCNGRLYSQTAQSFL
ncbi:GIP [Symbiodinium sp. CCMP2592]|nr:GIP [Symbiodinium sp. CCMP2592]